MSLDWMAAAVRLDGPGTGIMKAAATVEAVRLHDTEEVSPMLSKRSPSERFWSKVNKTESCWLWAGAISNGYGHFWAEGGYWLAHRYAYLLKHGFLPPNLDHLCRVRNCVNTEHLEPVTRGENVLRGDTIPARNLRKTHCPQGHPYDEENTYRHRGKRQCQLCRQVRRDEYHARQKAMVC